MLFEKVNIKGVFVIILEKYEDDRGFFARAWCKKEFELHGLNSKLVQANIAFNRKKGTVRGMHYQVSPYQEAKLIRCIKGAVYDVIIDLRPNSETYRKWFGVELTSENRKMLYVPEDFAHGYQTLTDDTEVFYQVSQFYAPKYERGIRWDDPFFGIKWPKTNNLRISEKDKHWPDYSPGGQNSSAPQKD